MTRRLFPLVLVLTACPSDPSSPEVTDTGDDGAVDDESGGTTGSASQTSMTGPVETSEDSGSEESGPPPDEDDGQITVGFITDMGGEGPEVECSVWDQDCPPDQKCMPWANDGGVSWNATRCVPIDPDPGQPGDPCTVEGTGVSGVDTCAVSSMCWNVDPETNQGTCIAFCDGSENNPICDDPTTTCSITNDGVLILCLPNCDPLIQNCEVDGEACYGIPDGYVCAPDVSGEMGAYGEPCEAINVCDPGLECVAAETVPNCGGAVGCCTEFCDISDPMGTANCAGAAGGQECLSAFPEGAAPPGYEDVGYCLIPT